MPELVSRTVRIRRGWLDRLRGFAHVYETKLTDGYRAAVGRATCPYTSQYHAHRLWKLRAGEVTETTDYDLPSPAPSIALNGHSMSLGGVREVIDALRADNARLLRWLIKRGIDGPEHEKLAEILVRIRTSGTRLQKNVDEEP